jgi:NADH:ubiquinone oxidoreductase subunit F (NADH-binding)/(2Fe-2S) ferredoxin
MEMNKATEVKLIIGMGTCGLASGAAKVREAAENWAREQGLPCSITATGCLGYCQMEPIMDAVTASGHRLAYGSVTPDKVPGLLEEIYLKGQIPVEGLLGQHPNGIEPLPGIPAIAEHPFFKKQVKFALRNCGIIDPVDLTAYRARGGFKGLERALGMTQEEVIEEILASGLRGRGGAGFPTGMKWRFAFQASSDKKYMICNADEGDPGAFMDRSLLEGDPYAVLEGLMIAGYAIGAGEGIIYCRAEYPLAIKRLQTTIAVLEQEKLLNASLNSKGYSFSLRIKKGAGAFVCGEETALLHSIEGKRGMPRPRPPFPAISGLFEQPTIINNVETLANVPNIMREGAAAFAAMGTEKSKGTKVFALTGKVKNTGLVEVPMGITLREIIYDIGGGIENDKAFKAVQTGGPSGGCISAEHLDIKIDYDSLKTIGAMMGSGGLVVMDEDTCMVDIAKFFLAFTTKESCGKCIPCREGTQRMYEILEKITSPYSQMKSEEENLERFNMVMRLENLAQTIKDTALCALGQTAPNPVLSTLRFFRDEYEAHIYDRKCPAKACKSLLTYEIDNELCKGCTLCAKKCPADAIVGEKGKAHYIVQDKCIHCGQCLESCKFDAVIAS